MKVDKFIFIIFGILYYILIIIWYTIDKCISPDCNLSGALPCAILSTFYLMELVTDLIWS